MLNINEDDLKAAIVAKATDEILSDSDELEVLIKKEVPLLNSEWMPGRIRLSLSEP